MFWTPNEAATLTYYISVKSLESEQHEYGNNLDMKFCDLSLILWEQVSFDWICHQMGQVMLSYTFCIGNIYKYLNIQFRRNLF